MTATRGTSELLRTAWLALGGDPYLLDLVEVKGGPDGRRHWFHWTSNMSGWPPPASDTPRPVTATPRTCPLRSLAPTKRATAGCACMQATRGTANAADSTSLAPRRDRRSPDGGRGVGIRMGKQRTQGRMARQEKLGFAMRGRDERLERPQGRAVATPPLPGRSTGNNPGHRPRSASRSRTGSRPDPSGLRTRRNRDHSCWGRPRPQTRQPQAARKPSPGRLTCSPASAARS